jgi:hypothetical protein
MCLIILCKLFNLFFGFLVVWFLIRQMFLSHSQAAQHWSDALKAQPHSMELWNGLIAFRQSQVFCSLNHFD